MNSSARKEHLKVNGHKYTYYEGYKSKERANKTAKLWRKKENGAIVTHTADGYHNVYIWYKD